MTTYTHPDLLAAIDGQKMNLDPESLDVTTFDWGIALAHNAHLDTLAALLDLHTAWKGESWWPGPYCSADARLWTCPTVQVVVDALTRMGAL